MGFGTEAIDEDGNNSPWNAPSRDVHGPNLPSRRASDPPAPLNRRWQLPPVSTDSHVLPSQERGRARTRRAPNVSRDAGQSNSANRRYSIINPSPHKLRSLSTSSTGLPLDGRATEDIPALNPTGMCTECKLPMHGRSIIVGPGNGQQYHYRCFRCTTCHEPVSGREYVLLLGRPCHRICFLREMRPPHIASTASSGTVAALAPTVEPRSIGPASSLRGLHKCGGCGVGLSYFESVVGQQGRRYHQTCLRCRRCGREKESGTKYDLDEHGLMGFVCSSCRAAQADGDGSGT